MTKTLAASKQAFCILFILNGLVTLCQAGENMIGRQTHNEGMLVLPTPGKVVIDGKLDDWDWSGRIWVFADTIVRDRYSVEAAAMWDEDYLYLGAKWLDPTPMVNHVNPDFNFDDGWKSDSWQLRIKSDDTVHYTIWNFTDADQANFHVTYSAKGRGGETFVLKAPNGKVMERGVQVAFQKTGNNSYTQEVRVPWDLVFRTPPTIEPGVTFRMGNEFLWGDITGKTWPSHRYADNMQPGVTSREFYWQNWKAWGDCKLLAKGNVPIRQYTSDEGLMQGTLPIRVEIPADAVRFTIAIDDANGNRIRNLAGDMDPRDYTAELKDKTRLIEVPWDCLDDDGKPVPAGAYTARGLTHAGITATYDMTYYNPGSPPWLTADGTGGWGSNHADPRGVVRSGHGVVVYWPHTEGGHAIIKLNAEGRKTWGELTGATALTADAENVYAIEGGHRGKQQLLFRMDAMTGAYKPFTLDGQARDLHLPTAELVGEKEATNVVGLDSDGKKLAIALESGTVALLDAESAELIANDHFPGVQDVAFNNLGTHIYALVNGKVHLLDTSQLSVIAVVPTPGVGEPTRIAVDLDGNILVTDLGPDSQIKAFSPKGEPVYTVGQKGGRPWSGIWQPQGMLSMGDFDVDSKGRIWVAETWQSPRRISVWGKDGKLVKDYIGCAAYAGSDSWLDEHDPSLAYMGPVEMKLNRETRSYQVTRILWHPDPEKNEAFSLWRDLHWYPQAQAIVSSASGKQQRYIYYNGLYSRYHAVYLDDGNSAKPVAAIVNANHFVEILPNLDLGTTDKKTVVFWNDTNGDAAVSKDECTIGPEMNIFAFWGNRMDNQLGVHVGEGDYIKPIRFTDRGAPVYGPASITRLGLKENGEYIPVPGEERVLLPSKKGYPRATRLLAFHPKTGDIQWTYPNPYPGVHGSHRATMPEPGLLIGILKVCGVANIGGEAGKVFAMRGNLGQDYYMTTDGLYIGAMFQDTRLPGDSLPSTEEELIGMAMDGFSEGGEPFSGWFGKQNDGKVRMITSMSRKGALIIQIHGLEDIDRFDPIPIKLDDATLAQAIADNAARQAESLGKKSYTIVKKNKAPKVDANDREWKTVPAILIERKGMPSQATAKLAYDDTHLYTFFEVDDPNPWINEGKDAKILFKTGDAVDIQLGSNDGKSSDPQAGDQRIVFGRTAGKDVAMLLVPVDPKAPKDAGFTFYSPTATKPFDRVEMIDGATIAVKTQPGKYMLEAAIPLKALKGIRPRSGHSLRGDVGFISSNAAGNINTARTYWSNKETNLVNDLPFESVLFPDKWGELVWE